MAITNSWTVIGIFEDQANASEAMDDLRQSGFTDEQLGYVFREGVPTVSKIAGAVEENTQPGAIVEGNTEAAKLTPAPDLSAVNTIPTASIPVAETTPDKLNGSEAAVEREQISHQPTEPLSDAMKTSAPVTMNETTEQQPVSEEVGEPATEKARTSEATGAVTGGIVGGVLGAAVALLIPVLGPVFAGGILVTAFSAALGAVTGGFLGTFMAMGVPEEEAQQYEQEFKSGRTIVTVKTNAQQQQVLDILYRHGARYANAHDRL